MTVSRRHIRATGLSKGGEQMLTIDALIMLAVAVLIVFVSNRPKMCGAAARQVRGDRALCLAVFAAGCVLRLVCLGSLPGGLSAEEALVGAQAKALFETGGFLFTGRLTTQFQQWAGESSGPLLAALSAPLVGLMGTTAWAVRLPLALLSIAAMPAAYALGRELAGKTAGLIMLILYALCPYFVLAARMTASANAAVFLLPIALWALCAGMKRSGLLYLGMALLGLMAYAQDLYFFISPLAVIAAAVVAAMYGVKKRHVFLSAALGLALCLPAAMTAYVNICALEGFTLFGLVDVPALEAFDKADMLFDTVPSEGQWVYLVLSRMMAALIGGVFQSVAHENFSAALYLPEGMLALTVVSLPLIALGALSLALRRIDGGRAGEAHRGARTLVIALFAVVLLCETLWGSEGAYIAGGATSLYDHSALFLFSALLMTAGFMRMMRVSLKGSAALAAMFALCVTMLGVHLFGGDYNLGANVYFNGFAGAAKRAAQLQAETGAKVMVTGRVYPHRSPSAAAEMMYLFAADADPASLPEYEVIYAQGMEGPQADQIYLVHYEDVYDWDFGDMAYEEFGDFVVLSAGE